MLAPLWRQIAVLSWTKRIFHDCEVQIKKNKGSLYECADPDQSYYVTLMYNLYTNVS